MGKSVVRAEAIDANLEQEQERTKGRLQSKHDRFQQAERLLGGTERPSVVTVSAAPVAAPKPKYVPKPNKVATEKFSFHPDDLERLERLQERMVKYGLRYRSEVLRVALIALEQQGDDALKKVAEKLDILKPGKVRQRKSTANVGN